MRLSILLPQRVFLERDGINRILVPCSVGSLGILPRRLDFAASLVPGILEFTDGAGETWIAVSDGIVVKAGDQILAAVHDAAGSSGPGSLRGTVEETIRVRAEERKALRETMARFEADFVHRFMEARKHG